MKLDSAAKLARAGLCMAAALILAGCATATPYQPAGKSGYGYSQEQLENDRYRVTFTGNDHTPSETVQNYLLYRAARITLNTGNDYFIITHQGTEHLGGGSSTGFSVGTGGAVGGGVGVGIGIGTLLGGTSGRFRAYAVIVVGKGSKPAQQPHAYDAHQIMQRLQPKIRQSNGKNAS